MQMNSKRKHGGNRSVQIATAILAVTAVAASFTILFHGESLLAQEKTSSAIFLADGKLKLPSDFRNWVFVGGPVTPNGVTPNGLNGGEANFPEFHNVYVEARNLKPYKEIGKFPEGTLIVKELTLVLNPTFPDGSRTEPSGRGFFNGPFNGIDATMKDSRRFAKTNGWGFFTFGHHAMPYAVSAAEAPVSECAGCHMANVAKTDMTWVQYYPLLTAKID
jgi:hypothetical protein